VPGSRCYECNQSLDEPTSNSPSVSPTAVAACAVALNMPPGSIPHHHDSYSGFLLLGPWKHGRRWEKYRVESVSRPRLAELPAFLRALAYPGGAYAHILEDWLVRVRYGDSPLYVEWCRDPQSRRGSIAMHGLTGNEAAKDVLRAHEGIRLVYSFLRTARHPGRPTGSTGMTEQEFRSNLAAQRQALRDEWGHEPSTADLAIALGISRPTYYRYRERGRTS
jgi:hypothetical protein